MAEALVGGAAVGAVFGELLRAVLKTAKKAILFKPVFIYLRSTLVAIAPTVQEMEQQNTDLGRPKEELESLIGIMREGIELVYKCSNIKKFHCIAKIRYHTKLVAVVDSLVQFFMIDLPAQNARDQKETLLKVRRIYSVVNKIPLVNREDTRASSSSSAKQVMEPITETKQQEASQSKAKEGNNQGRKHLVSEKSYDQLGTTEKRSLGIHIPKKVGLNRQVKKATSIQQINKLDTGYDKTSYNKQVCPSEIVFLDSSYSFDLGDLLRGNAKVLGEGSYGTTYKAIWEDGSATLALKRLREVMISKTEFEKQVEILQTLFPHLPNVCLLRAYYYSIEEKVLIYDYIPFGSFSALLHERSRTRWTQLDLKSRLRISHGAAKGIAHIHSVSGKNFVHGNIKSSNVLVATDFQGYISDFGLTHLLGLSGIPSGNKGYQAPEVDKTRKLTQKSDVYSFGVLLLEMLTGKSPMDMEDPNLPSWVELQARDGLLCTLFDDVLKDGTKVGDIGLDMMRLARACASKVPNMRPSMDEVVGKIGTITSSYY